MNAGQHIQSATFKESQTKDDTPHPPDASQRNQNAYSRARSIAAAVVAANLKERCLTGQMPPHSGALFNPVAI